VINKTIYLTGCLSTSIIDALNEKRCGILNTPQNNFSKRQIWNRHWIWAADNGCFNTDTYVGDDAWWQWLTTNAIYAETCLFATAPDVMGNHDETIIRSTPWLPEIRKLGYPAAFVAQNGATIETIPWPEFDVLFIGGDNTFKLGNEMRTIAAHAQTINTPTHMGRVNSLSRFSYAQSIGCQSVDGTFLAFGPHKNAQILEKWITHLDDNPPLPLQWTHENGKTA